MKHLKKSLGQHFLIRPEIPERIASFLTMNGYADALEVGPGDGMLTQFLIKHFPNLVSVEFDSDMIPVLQEKFVDTGLNLVHADFLKININDYFEGSSFALVGNFPYNISSQIVFKMLDNIERVPEMVGMFQKEMAMRILADHGSKTYGVISVLTKAFYRGESMMILKPGSFNPPPKVNSMVIRLQRLEKQPDVPYKILRRVVKGAFSQRRKKLSNALKGNVPRDILEEMSLADLRAEQVSVQTFIELAQKITHLGDS